MNVVMNIPILILLGFAGWTLLTLCIGIGVYRWSLIFAGRASIGEWRADTPQGSDWYQRAMRAHMNCVENLPVLGALVVAQIAMNVQSPSINALFVTLFIARIGQTLVHLAPSFNNGLAALRFTFFSVQVACMISTGTIIVFSTIN
jgi:uncharacterized MAPEG superfamily protein